eukprot:449459_1
MLEGCICNGFELPSMPTNIYGNMHASDCGGGGMTPFAWVPGNSYYYADIPLPNTPLKCKAVLTEHSQFSQTTSYKYCENTDSPSCVVCGPKMNIGIIIYNLYIYIYSSFKVRQTNSGIDPLYTVSLRSYIMTTIQATNKEQCSVTLVEYAPSYYDIPNRFTIGLGSVDYYPYLFADTMKISVAAGYICYVDLYSVKFGKHNEVIIANNKEGTSRTQFKYSSDDLASIGFGNRCTLSSFEVKLVDYVESIKSGTKLYGINDDVLYSSSCDTRLVMHSTGDLVLYNVDDVVLWSSNTAPISNARTNVQRDGNLVIYDSDNKAHWSSKTHEKRIRKPYILTVIDDDGGKVVLTANDGTILWSKPNNVGAFSLLFDGKYGQFGFAVLIVMILLCYTSSMICICRKRRTNFKYKHEEIPVDSDGIDSEQDV